MHPDLAHFLIICSWLALITYGNMRMYSGESHLSSQGVRMVLGFTTFLFVVAINVRPIAFELLPALLVGTFFLAVPRLAERIPMLREREDESANPGSAQL